MKRIKFKKKYKYAERGIFRQKVEQNIYAREQNPCKYISKSKQICSFAIQTILFLSQACT